ncbi:hypothetical protein LVY72_20260 [Arthrobacter sp. I2-34]|uniref:MarR family transcriptional regulator n=1 Tax=Arthrobacter hankyongi TaxID=2904801 RepID=A0ABS9LC20_9MICC|nr:hypothetical protein [Arthrobacter hankyongi]MCG2624227.1 hypothetical protein [Arthrobacter hankyongi]
MYVLTINGRGPRPAADQVPGLVRTLRHLPALIGFQRSVADEVIGVVPDPDTAVQAALGALRSRRWNVGIGAGAVHPPLPEAVGAAGGPGLVYARRAVDRARTAAGRVPLAVEGADRGPAAEAEAVLRLLGGIVAGRSPAEWKVLDLLTPGARGQQKLVAQELGISAQAVSKAVVRSRWNEEWACRPAAARLLALASGA